MMACIADRTPTRTHSAHLTVDGKTFYRASCGPAHHGHVSCLRFRFRFAAKDFQSKTMETGGRSEAEPPASADRPPSSREQPQQTTSSGEDPTESHGESQAAQQQQQEQPPAMERGDAMEDINAYCANDESPRINPTTSGGGFASETSSDGASGANPPSGVSETISGDDQSDADGADDEDFVEVSPVASSSPPPSSSSPSPASDARRDDGENDAEVETQPGDLLENVARHLLGHPVRQAQLDSRQRGEDFLRQVQKDFADASGDLATSASALRASIQSSLQASPRIPVVQVGGTKKVRQGGDRGGIPADASRVTSSTRFGVPPLPPLAAAAGSATQSAAKAPPPTSPAGNSSATIASGTKPTPKVSRRTERALSFREHAHSFREHTYKQPTYCGICSGLLVGLWSQGFKCELCDMNVHRGGGAGDHDDCRAEALLAPCPGPEHVAEAAVTERKTAEPPKLKDVVSQIRALAENPNFIKDLSEQVDKDIRARAKEAIVEAAVDDERNKNLRRLREALVPFVAKLDATEARGELYVFVVLMTILSLATIIQTVLSMTLFLIALGPRHGFLSTTSFQLAAMHDATVTAALHAVLAILSAVTFHLASVFKRKQNLIHRFLLDALRINAASDIGISVADAARRLMSWSQRLLVSTLVSMTVSCFFWHQAQPVSWAAAKLPPMANILIPSFVFTLCAGAVSYASYRNAPADIGLESYVDVKSEMIQNEIDIAATKRTNSQPRERTKKNAEPNLMGERHDQPGSGLADSRNFGKSTNFGKKNKAVEDAELHDLLDELVPSGAVIE